MRNFRPGNYDIAGTWFLHWAVRYRWVGATPVQLLDMHKACMEILEAYPEAEGADLAKILNAVGEDYYPKIYADEWMEQHPIVDRAQSE